MEAEQTKQRELKFRVWDKVDYMGYFTLNDLATRKIEFTDDCPVMQWTGLFDKNNTPIYENDIVKVYDEVYREVIFRNAFWHFDDFIPEGVLGGFGTKTDDNGLKPLYRYPKTEIEVIGNRFSNPELLNQL